MNRLRAVFSSTAAADLSMAPVGKAVDNRAANCGNRCLVRAATRCLRKRQRGHHGWGRRRTRSGETAYAPQPSALGCSPGENGRVWTTRVTRMGLEDAGIPHRRRNRMSRLLCSRRSAAAAAVASLLLVAACQRNEAPTPGVAGSTANAPAAASSAPATVPTTGDAQVGAGKSPGAPGPSGRSAPEGVSGSSGTLPAPSSAPDPAASGMPAIAPASASGTAAPSQAASAPGS